MDKRNIKFVAVSGYGWSGSSAVVNLLKEFRGYWECGGEMRLLREPYGIFDLEHALLEAWDLLNSDAAIKDFLWLTQRLNRSTSRWGGTGCGYGKLFGSSFWKETQKYVDELIKFEYQGHWWWFEFKQSNFCMALNRIKRRLQITDYEELSKMCFVDISENEFLDKTKNYLLNLYWESAQERSIDLETVILDQAMSINQFPKAQRYFDKIKLIVVDRDPRDVFVDIINGKRVIGRELANHRSVDKFVAWYKKMRMKVAQYDRDKVLFIQFEDLILNYEDTLVKILDFLEESKEIHLHEHNFLSLDNSKKNIGMWKEYAFQDDIRKIEQELM